MVSKKSLSWRGGGVTGAFGFAARSSQQIASLNLTLMAAAWFSPAKFGVYSLAMFFVALVQIVSTTGYFHFVVTDARDEP